MPGRTPGFSNQIPGRDFALKRGVVLADGKRFFRSIQPAVDYASDTVHIGPGTFNETVTIDTEGLYFTGSGWNTRISASEGRAVEVTSGKDVVVTNLQADTADDSTDGSVGGAIYHNGERGQVSRVLCNTDNANTGIYLDADRQMVQNCVVFGAGYAGIQSVSSYSTITSNIVQGVGTDGIRAWTIGNEVVANIVYNPDSRGIEVSGSESGIVANRVAFTTDEGIRGAADDQVIAANVVGGGGGGGAGGDGISINSDGQAVGLNRVMGSSGDDFAYGSATNTAWGVNLSSDGTEGENEREQFVYDPGMTNWETGLADEEVARLELQAGESLVVERIEFRQKGGGTSANASIDVRDADDATTVGSQTLGGTTKDAGSSTDGTTVLVRLSNSTGDAIDAEPRVIGFIDGA